MAHLIKQCLQSMFIKKKINSPSTKSVLFNFDFQFLFPELFLSWKLADSGEVYLIGKITHYNEWHLAQNLFVWWLNQLKMYCLLK